MSGNYFRTVFLQTLAILFLTLTWLWFEKWEILTEIDILFISFLYALTAILSSLASALLVELFGRINRSKLLLFVVYVVTGMVAWLSFLVTATKITVWAAIAYSLEHYVNNSVQFLWSDYGSVLIAGLAFLVIAISGLPTRSRTKRTHELRSGSKS